MNSANAKSSAKEGNLETPSNLESIVVVCASDNNYAMPLAVTMRSAIENLNPAYRILFYIIDGGISISNKRKILRSLIPNKCEVEFIQIPDSLIKDVTEAHELVEKDIDKSKPAYISIASFYRLLIPELLPKHIDKAMYLDCDLVIKKDLSELWQTEFGEHHILAVRDAWIPNISSFEGKLNYQVLGIDPTAPYFNAGVLLMAYR
jgi:lipopolysaccharide biosynthesis glycosyltransferase